LKSWRFNVVFANGGRVYYLREHIINFLTKTWGTPNRLLKAVLEDASNDLYIAGCKALGLIDKFITTELKKIKHLSNIIPVSKGKQIMTTIPYMYNN